ncbi:MAG: DUF1501 domain-containing protein, partial [Pirellula sp.]
MLFQSSLGLGGVALTSLLSSAVSGHTSTNTLQKDSQIPHHPPRAKRVIHFFLNGGPSHVDTFDPKPALQTHAGKPLSDTLTTERKTGAAFPSPFKFKKYGESGIEVSELFE